MFRVIVAGGRTFSDYVLLNKHLTHILEKRMATDKVVIVSGTANGADTLGEKFAEDHNLEVCRFPADWNRFGKSAGYKRNVQMAENADALVAFWDGQSRGTAHMINIAKERGLQVRVVRY